MNKPTAAAIVRKPHTVPVNGGGVVACYVEGQVYCTSRGRVTTPFPRFTDQTEVRRRLEWLLENALAEALAEGDLFNARQFHASRRNPSPADADGAELYLFSA